MLLKCKRVLKDVVKAAIIAVIQAGFRLFGRDLTDLAAAGPFLVIAPHPDDETLGCGGVIARACAAGQPVRIVIVTDGRAASYKTPITPDRMAAMRREEALRATACLGVGADDVVFLDVPDGEAARHKRRVAEALGAQIASVGPRLIFSPYGIDDHPDHRVVADALEEACRLTPPGCPILEYPVWFWLNQALAMIVHPRRALQVRYIRTEGYKARKRAAMKSYPSQFPHLVGEDVNHSYFPPLSFHAQYLKDYEVFFEKP